MPISSVSSATAIGQSGMRAAQQRLDTHAHNLANALTPGFQRQVSVQSAQPGGGVSTTVRRASADEAGTDGAGLTAHLADDLIGQRLSLYDFTANLQTVKVQDTLLGTLLDREA
jgi:flagellar hook protein FlgE